MSTLLMRPAPPALPATRTTPEIIRGSMWIIWIAAVLFLAAVVFGAKEHKDSVKTVARDAAPSIITAQHIKALLADMDANVVNELLLSTSPGPNSQKEISDLRDAYEKTRQKVTTELVSAAKNITYDDAERIPIEQIELQLGTYEAKAQKARDYREAGDKEKMIATYRESAAIMDQKLLTEADKLDRVNRDQLDYRYSAQTSSSIGTLLLVVFCGLFLSGALIALQIFLSNRTKRTFNPPLLAATGLTLLFLVYTMNAFLSESSHLARLKKDAFDSLSHLWSASALAYSANADESRYLLDKAPGNNYEAEFTRKVAAIAKAPSGSTLTDVGASINSTRMDPSRMPTFSGYLAYELKNVTFEGELQPAVESIETFAQYVAIDEKIRTLENQGNHKEAIALCVGTKPGESNWAFDRFDKALHKTIDINQDEFEQARANAESEVSHFGVSTPIVSLIVSLLTLLGLRPRLKEYSI